MSRVYDFIGIGLGPFNLSLACLTSPIEKLDGLFLERKADFDWHPGLMLEQAHLQTPFMSDLVTLADPTHPLSFLNYIKLQGRLYSFYIRENFFLMRSEYNQYCQWAARQLDNIAFNRDVVAVSYDDLKRCYCVTARDTRNGDTTVLWAKKLVLGTGPLPYMPSCCPEDDRIVHASTYLENKAQIAAQESITIIGSGQSAAEIYYDLLQEIDSQGYELNWITRSPRFFPLEYSKLTLEMTSPEWVDYFYALPDATRNALNSQQKCLYKGINSDLINDIYDLLYVKRLSANFSSHILTNSSLETVDIQADGRLSLGFMQQQEQQAFSLDTSCLVMATGYRYRMPEFIQGISHRIAWDKQGRFDVGRNYAIDEARAELFVQNAELHTHGFVTPDLGMACYRNSCIIREMLGYEYYPVEKRTGFQQFAAPVSTNGGKVATATGRCVDLREAFAAQPVPAAWLS